jgi:hypothetical protein
MFGKRRCRIVTFPNGNFSSLEHQKTGYPDPDTFSDMPRELLYKEFKLNYLRKEQRKAMGRIE